jgi:hypothetical protein
MRLPFKSYVTPNFDPILALETRKPEVNSQVFEFPRLAALSAQGLTKKNVFQIHGYVEPGKGVADGQLILGRRDFERAYADGSPLKEFLRQLLNFNPIFFIGCRLLEPPLRPLFEACRDMRKSMEVSTGEKAQDRYILLPAPP